MGSTNNGISIYVMGPGDNRNMEGWRSVEQTSDGSPCSVFEAGEFLDVDPSTMFQAYESSCGASTALDQQLCNITLADHNRAVIPYPSVMSSLGRNETDGVTCKTEPSSDWGNLVEGNFHRHSFGTLANDDSDFAVQFGRTDRLGHDGLFPIETSFPPGVPIDQPLSGISEQSTINTTPFNSSCSENSRGREWPSVRQHPYSSSHHRKRSSSVCGNPHLVGNQSRKRSASDANTSTDNGTASSSLITSRHLNIPNHGHFVHTPSWETGWSYDSQPLMNSMGRPSQFTSGCGDGSSPNVGHSRDFSWNHHRNQAFSHSLMEGASSPVQMSSGGTSPFKKQVASDAVVKAARKKRKDHGGKVFPCSICRAELTTKQNLQYHMCSHRGERNHQCDKCGKTFTTPHVRNRHSGKCKGLYRIDSS